MPVPIPADDHTNHWPPDAGEAQFLARGVTSVIRAGGELTPLQAALTRAMFEAMTSYRVDLDQPPVDAVEFACGLADRSEMFRSRILQMMILGALVLRPLPPDVIDRIGEFAAEMSVDDAMLRVAHRYAEGSLGLAAFDFQRNGYTSEWAAEHRHQLHTSRELAEAWDQCVSDPALAARWRSLEDLPEGTLGRRVADFYRARGFVYPGEPGSAPPLLAQHDWVHVVGDFGTTVESELEVFGFIARANDDPRGFSLLAMVVSLFETGYLMRGAGLFESYPGRLSQEGVAVRLADAVRRGALCDGSVDFMGVDWFDYADLPLVEVRARFGVMPKGAAAIAAGSVGPWQPGGVSEFQLAAGRALAEAEDRPYESFGAALA